MTRQERADMYVATLYREFANGRIDKWEYYSHLRELVDGRYTTITRICELVPTPDAVVRMRLRDLLHL